MGLARNLSRKLSRKAKSGKRFLVRGSKLEGLGARCKLPQRTSAWNPDRRCILDALKAQKTCIVAKMVASVIELLFLDSIWQNPWMPLVELLGSAEPQLKNTAEVTYLVVNDQYR